jgi:arabinogalactan endo-1,4-beta-galactosidase
MGGDGGETEIFAYVKINDEIAYKSSNMKITKYLEWDTGLIESFDYNGSDTISVGIYVKCQGSGNGAWGKIDDALLNSVSE